MEYDLKTRRHSAAHVMAAAVQSLFPDAKFDIGPATSDGFYYDFDMEHRLVPDDLKKIEKAMKKMLGRKLPFVCKELERSEAEAVALPRGRHEGVVGFDVVVRHPGDDVVVRLRGIERPQ